MCNSSGGKNREGLAVNNVTWTFVKLFYLAVSASSQVRFSSSTVHTERHQFKPAKTKQVIVKQHKVARCPLRRHEPMTSNLSSAVISRDKQVKQDTNRLTSCQTKRVTGGIQEI